MLGRSILVLAGSYLAATAILAVPTTAGAAVAQSTITRWQDNAPEALDITVVSVTESNESQPISGSPSCTRTLTTQTVTARVDVVHRSASRLQPGNVIVFVHSIVSVWPCAIPGGHFGQALNAGDRAAAYLRPADTGGNLLLANDVTRLR